MLAVPTVLGGARVDHRLDVTACLGAAVLLALIALGTAAFAADTSCWWRVSGGGVHRLLNATVRRHDPVTDRPDQLLAKRDGIRPILGTRWRQALAAAAGSTGFVWPCCAPAPVGADPQPALATTLLHRLAAYWLSLHARAVA